MTSVPGTVADVPLDLVEIVPSGLAELGGEHAAIANPSTNQPIERCLLTMRAHYAQARPQLADLFRSGAAEGIDVAEQERGHLGSGSAAALLSRWRSAERDRVAAEGSASVASLAAAAAAEAEIAANETSEAARLSMDAAQRAENAARRTAVAAGIAAASTSHEAQFADAALTASRAAEDLARTAFLDAQDLGFPREDSAKQGLEGRRG